MIRKKDLLRQITTQRLKIKILEDEIFNLRKNITTIIVTETINQSELNRKSSIDYIKFTKEKMIRAATENLKEFMTVQRVQRIDDRECFVLNVKVLK